MEASHTLEFLYKVIVVGEVNCGKTSIINRFVKDEFTNNYKVTLGADFFMKVMNIEKNRTVRLQLWDIAGQERFASMTRVFYREAVGAAIVFDMSEPATFDAVLKWKNDIDSKVKLPDGKPLPVILLANKRDLVNDSLNKEEMNTFCKENGFAGWHETSAKSNLNVDLAMDNLVKSILERDPTKKLKKKSDVDISPAGGSSGKDGGCCK